MKYELQKQDVQTHTKFSDGKNSIAEMVRAAIGFGFESIVISDHARGWSSKDGSTVEFFPTNEKFVNYLEQIKLTKDIYEDKIKIFSGLEIEVGIKGNLKLDRGIIEYNNKHKNIEKFGVDILIGSIHSESFEEDCKEFEVDIKDKRLILIDNMLNLIKNRKIDVFSHPFQAIHGQFSDNFTKEETESIINAFKTEWQSGHNIFFEINGKKYPQYEQWLYNKYEKGELKTHDINFLQQYKLNGGKFVIGSDAHSTQKLIETDFSILDKLALRESDIFIFS